MINKNRLNMNINKLELILEMLKLAANDQMSMVNIAKTLDLSPKELNTELDLCFSRYFKKAIELSEEDIQTLIHIKDSPSTRLLKRVFGYAKSDNVVFPAVDEDNFWKVIKNNYSARYYAVMSMHTGYDVEKPMSFDAIANELGCTKARVSDIYKSAVSKFDTNLLYEIYNFTYINKSKELIETIDFNRAKNEYEKLCAYINRVDDISAINKYIEENYPELQEVDFTIVNKELSISIDKLNISNKLIKVLNKNNIHTLADIYMTSAITFKNMPNFGAIKCKEMLEVLSKRNDNHPNRNTLIKNLTDLLD